MKTIKYLTFVYLPIILMLACTTTNHIISDNGFQKRKYTKGFLYSKKSPVNSKIHKKNENLSKQLQKERQTTSIKYTIEKNEGFKIDPTLTASVNDITPKQQLTKTIALLNKKVIFIENKPEKCFDKNKISQELSRTNEGSALASFWLALSSTLFVLLSLTSTAFIFLGSMLAILAIIFAINSFNTFKMYKNYPDVYKGKGFAIAGIILAIIVLCFVPFFYMLSTFSTSGLSLPF